MNVGTAKRIVIDVRNFMICASRLEMMYENESIIDIIIVV